VHLGVRLNSGKCEVESSHDLLEADNRVLAFWLWDFADRPDELQELGLQLTARRTGVRRPAR
jgi:hypothetical protein